MGALLARVEGEDSDMRLSRVTNRSLSPVFVPAAAPEPVVNRWRGKDPQHWKGSCGGR